jgi:periplasmic copper chaperone A
MRILALLILCLAATAATAKDFTHENITVRQPWARATIGELRMTAGFMEVLNTAEFTDDLIGAVSDAAEKIEIHKVENGAMMRVEGVEIEPSQPVTFAPGGYHLMIGPLTGPLAEGTTIPITLRFERAGEIRVEFEVEAADATAPN